ncbi:MAG: ribonuclease P [Thermoprotei archaeon]|nr:MAG: ribonuclease P [Thermoprotei archaeon]
MALGTSSREDSASIKLNTLNLIPKYVRRGYKKRVKDLALQRARLLYLNAVREVREGEVDRGRDYVKLALRLLEKANAKKPLYLRRWVCKNCYAPLIPGLTASVRVKGDRKYVIIAKKCLLCGWVSRVRCVRRR